MITFRIGDMKFEYHTPKDNAWNVVSFSEFVLNACALEEIMSVKEEPTLVICDAHLLIDPNIKGEE